MKNISKMFTDMADAIRDVKNTTNKYSIDTIVTDLSGINTSSNSGVNATVSRMQYLNYYCCTIVRPYAFYSCTALTSINLPLATSIETGAFYSCTALTSINLPLATSIGVQAFYGCTALTSIIIRTSTVCTLSSTSVFRSTPINSGTGYIYVPSILVDSYKSATNWSTYSAQIRAIEDYPDITGG